MAFENDCQPWALMLPAGLILAPLDDEMMRSGRVLHCDVRRELV
jgi:hypothetical protein